MTYKACWLLFVSLAVASCVSTSSNWESVPSEWKSAAVWQCDSVEYDDKDPAASSPDFSQRALISVKDMKICNQSVGISATILIEDISRISYNSTLRIISVSTKSYKNYQGSQWDIDFNTEIAVMRIRSKRKIINYYRCQPHANLAGTDEGNCFSPAEGQGLPLSILRSQTVP
ncbi:hypothetical protein FFK22_028800 [Mycobacterium sp. KBS0706]|uniref:hypothetical protein n=1 Tax=Mycobacterium sp. KBS0706 TaxID=2578109 RepID=UPI00110FE853|nr:hypothetical protein [Mycobacterium sp. KBS0706]TSD85150.1 hypothetical protein FFK22_028800 [Mycobacterium sp. KBS0706]